MNTRFRQCTLLPSQGNSSHVDEHFKFAVALNRISQVTGNWIKLGERSFTLSSQQKFAEFTGDINPIHVDPKFARKTNFGQCIVHGVSGLMWALDLLDVQQALGSLKAEFKKPIFLDQIVTCLWQESNGELRILASHGEVLSVFKVQEAETSAVDASDVSIGELERLERPFELNFSELPKAKFIRSRYGGDESLAQTLFPNLCGKIGIAATYEMGILSNLVGMQVPGLNSLLSSCELDFHVAQSKPEAGFEVIRSDERFNLVELAYYGKNIGAKVVAFERPTFKPKKCSELKQLIPKSLHFHGKSLLIVGGSRGIGAALARVAALAHGEVTITYSVGKEEADDVCADILATTRRSAKCMQLDVTNPCAMEGMKFDVICYFATPGIFGRGTDLFELQKFERFYDYYCKCFEALVRNLGIGSESIVYYPSSVAVEQDVKGLEEYRFAKAIGEKLCASLEREMGIEVIIDRLGRTETDQTMTITRTPSADSAIVAIEIAKRLYQKLSNIV